MSTSVPGWPHSPNPLEPELMEEHEQEVERDLVEAQRRHETEEHHPYRWRRLLHRLGRR